MSSCVNVFWSTFHANHNGFLNLGGFLMVSQSNLLIVRCVCVNNTLSEVHLNCLNQPVLILSSCTAVTCFNALPGNQVCF